MALPAQAQIIPDTTLGNENSILTPDIEVRGNIADLIEGGATRGSNLFHSFSDFNINAGQQVYFANPADIESILSRVTGNNASDIFGTLGVDGNAALFLINPNGIVFGPDVSLDIEGSFYATTAEAVELGDGVFSASAPEQSQLLAISPSTVFWNYLTDDSGDVVNRGLIAVGGNLVFAGNNLDLEAQVAGANDVSLLAIETIKIRDTEETPFIGYAGGDLLIQGNEQVDLVVLSHPDSGLFSYKNMVLRSMEQVHGDAHYFSRGNFQIEDLSGRPGDLNSPIDPIIRTFGDVVIDQYLGSSLHILAGGSVTLNAAFISGADAGRAGIDFLQEIVTLSDETTIAIDGGMRPTLDIRAGVSPQNIGQPPLEALTGFAPLRDILFGVNFTDTPTNADISIGDVILSEPNSLALITNQYAPNRDIETGSISIRSRFAPINGFGGVLVPNGNIFLDARDNITVIDSAIATESVNSENGDVVLLAEESITFTSLDNLPTGANTGTPAANNGQGRNLRISAANLEITNGARLGTFSTGAGNAGNIIVNVRDTLLLSGINPVSNLASSIFSTTVIGSEGNSGDLVVSANNIEVSNGAEIFSSTSGEGDAGDITLEITETARFSGVDFAGTTFGGVRSNVEPTGGGDAGNITLTAANLEVIDGAALNTATLGLGNAGNIILEIKDSARFDSLNSGAFSSVARGFLPGIGAIVAEGRGGDIELTAANLEVTNGAQISSVTSGIGDAGNVMLNITNTARFDGSDSTGTVLSSVGSSVTPTGEGTGGNIELRATNLEVTNGALLTSSTFGIGDAGNVILDISGTARFDGVNPVSGLTASAVGSSIEPGGVGNGGDIELTANDLEVTNGAQLTAISAGIGDAGNVILDISGTARFDGVNPVSGLTASAVGSSIEPGGVGNGGDIELTANDLEVTNGAQLTASTAGIGNAGAVLVKVANTARFDGVNPVNGVSSGIGTIVDINGVGNGGDVELNATSLSVSNGAQLSAIANGAGNAGDIRLVVSDEISLDNSGLITAARVNSGGQINIEADNIFLRNNSDILTLVGNGAGQGGSVTIVADFVVALEDSDILAFSADGRGGGIDLSQTTLFSQNLNFVSGAASREELLALINNNRVDINATGSIESGRISINDASFIENSLNELPDDVVSPETLVASSCIARSNDTDNSFIVTGSGGLPQQANSSQTTYSTGNIQTTGEQTSTFLSEPQKIYHLANGRLVMSRDCNTNTSSE